MTNHQAPLAYRFPTCVLRHAVVKAVKRRRLELGLSIERAAERAQLDVEQWHEFEAGKRKFDPVVQDAMSAVVSAVLQVDYLLELLSAAQS